jgi:competence protein ComEA
MMSRLLTRREQLVLGFLGLAIVTGSITVFALRTRTHEPEAIVVEPVDRATQSSDPADADTQDQTADEPKVEVVVSVQGAIAKPGVYTVDEGSRVHELIQRAGGLLGSADTSLLNLAARLIDGTTLTVPSRSSSADSEATTQNPDAYTVAGQATQAGLSGASGSGRININTATQAQLETLPGIGPKLAQEIIRFREDQPFRDVAQLDDVSGIGPAKLEAVSELVTVQ